MLKNGLNVLMSDNGLQFCNLVVITRELGKFMWSPQKKGVFDYLWDRKP
jgi:hypothetical protein